MNEAETYGWGEKYGEICRLKGELAELLGEGGGIAMIVGTGDRSDPEHAMTPVAELSRMGGLSEHELLSLGGAVQSRCATLCSAIANNIVHLRYDGQSISRSEFRAQVVRVLTDITALAEHMTNNPEAMRRQWTETEIAADVRDDPPKRPPLHLAPPTPSPASAWWRRRRG